MFKNPFSFSGRIRRMEYGLSVLIYIAILGILELGLVNLRSDGGLISIIFLVVYIPMLWFMIAQGAKRCHDRGNTGWFMLIPFYGFWMLFADSEIGSNIYGPNPKGIGNVDEIDQIGNYLTK